MNEWLNQYSTLIWTMLLYKILHYFDQFYVCVVVIMVTALKFKNETGLTKSNI